MLCIECSKPLKGKARLCCSQKCFQLYAYHSYTKKWISKEISGLMANGINPSKYIKRYILERDNNRCVLCGWNEVNPHTRKSPLHLDHIDGDYRNCSPDNLRILCPNCHSLTSTYGSLNIGKGKPWHVKKRTVS